MKKNKSVAKCVCPYCEPELENKCFEPEFCTPCDCLPIESKNQESTVENKCSCNCVPAEQKLKHGEKK